MDTKTIIETAEEKLIHTYNRYQIVLDKGDGVRLYDKDGKEYLDFGAGIAVFALGYNNKEYNDAVKAQVDKLIHTSNYFYNEPAVKAAQAVTKASGMDRVFFTNSGTEAVEGAIKLAKKYAYLKDGSTDHEIIAMEHSFHGRSMGALAVTGNRHYQEAFGPMIPGIKFAKYNDLESVKSLVNDKTCAIIFETVQGEGGVYPATKEFLQGLRKFCDENDMLLLFDEVQTGWGRTGDIMAYMEYGVKPDAVSMAKAIGGGMPIGAMCTTEKFASAFTPGAHGSTYAANPVCCAAALAEIEEIMDNNLAANAKEVGAYFMEQLKALPCVKEIRGKGLLVGVEFREPIAFEVKHQAVENRLLITAVRENIIRLAPPLIANKEQCDEAVKILIKCVSAALVK